MEYSKKTVAELKAICKERSIKGITGKNKKALIELLEKTSTPAQVGNTVVYPSSSNNKNALSLFSGAGGDTCGLEAAGWVVTHFSEFKKTAIQTHQAAFPASSLLTGEGKSTDITKIPDETFKKLTGKIDLIFAGFPCQGFSHAGKKRVNDPRNELVHQFARAVRIIKPTWIIGENVKGLLSRKGVFPANTKARPVIEIICELFESIGYKISWRVIDVREVGVPQLRKRLILIGHKGSKYPVVPWESALKIPAQLGIRNLLTPTLEGAVELPSLYKPKDQDTRFWIPTEETVVTGTPHPNLERLVAGKRNLSSKEKEEQNLDKEDKVEFIDPKGLISFGVRKSGYHGQVLDPDAPSKTIICAYNQCPRLFVGLYSSKQKKYYIRCLTHEECGQIQGFPANYPWQGTVKDKITQIGNAVPPPLATTIAHLLPKITFSKQPQVNTQADESDSEEEEE
jgi:DNA (cytosine-5)-methyltransferase 1